MLEHLHIKNLALIEDMTLEFSDGINVLTGETGAGKSFILKALGFLMGEKLSADIVRPGADRAQVEAIFQLEGKELVLRRELMASTGRSRFYINDATSSQEALRELRQKLLSHTSQHAQQQLLQPAFQASLLENELNAPDLLRRRDELLAKLRDIAARIRELQQKQASLAEKRELLEMQKAEIDRVAPLPGEEERLEELRSHARANISAKQNYNRAMSILHGDEGPGLLQMLQDFEHLMAMIGGEEGEKEAKSIADFRQQISHMAATLPKPQAREEKVDMDSIEERLFAFAQLRRKLKRTLPEILALKDEIQENLSFLDVCALDLSRLNKEQSRLASELGEAVDELRPLRREAAATFSQKLETELRDLGFSEHVRVIPDFTSQEIWPGVNDERGRLNWAPNPGQNPQPLDRIASGGELSRFLLALNTLGSEHNDLTFIFDEVDAGVGGLTLNRLAAKLEALAAVHQIILITHWPQLAARARRHFHITKLVRDQKTFTICNPLDDEERKQELARMAGGGREGEAMAENLLEKQG